MFKLALSAGHGMNTFGKRCLKVLDKNQTREWYLNSRICEKIEDELEKYSNVCVMRLDDKSGKEDIALKKRTDIANSFGADLYLSIHHNAGINGGDGGGIVAYVYTKASRESVEWQNELYDLLIKYTDLKGNRSEGKSKANFHECRESKMPCVLLECGFMDSKIDVPIILSEDFSQKVAKACVEAIVKKAKLKEKENVNKQNFNIENKVLEWQRAAVRDGFSFLKYGIDGIWGEECNKIAEKAVCKKRLKYTYINLTKIIQKTVGVTVDGKFGNKTKTAVKEYQKKNGLIIDGCVGVRTWKKILGVK